jgi:acyl-lipid omega-6 desaturase (Delta-12 desaturase)
MAKTTIPTDPDQRFKEFIEKSDALEGQKITAAIPREYLQPSVARGFAGLVVSLAVYVGAIVAIAAVDQWYLIPPLLVVAGLGGWGLHCIAHECGHGSFSRNRRLNFAVGQFALLHLLYPFHAWRHVHNLHHAHTNSLELDTDWAPIPEAVYRRMSVKDRLIYISVRTWAVWGGSIHHWLDSGLRPSYFPKKEMRRDARRSIMVVAAVGGGYLATLTYFTGWQGLLLYFVGPWLATHVWFSITTLMHHSAEDIPYLSTDHWTKNASRLLVTTDFMYPKWLLFLTHNISVHTAHHVSPAVPFYHLPKAQEALMQAYPEMMRVEKASISRFWNILRNCRFYDPVSGLYSTSPMRRVDSVEKEMEPA